MSILIVSHFASVYIDMSGKRSTWGPHQTLSNCVTKFLWYSGIVKCVSQWLSFSLWTFWMNVIFLLFHTQVMTLCCVTGVLPSSELFSDCQTSEHLSPLSETFLAPPFILFHLSFLLFVEMKNTAVILVNKTEPWLQVFDTEKKQSSWVIWIVFFCFLLALCMRSCQFLHFLLL